MILNSTTISVPFLLHIIGETGATFGFALLPSQTLRQPQPHAHAVIRQFALLLLSSNLIAAIFLFEDKPSAISCKVAGALALYHIGPFTRAALKIRNGEMMGIWEGLGGAWVHVVFHSFTAAALGWEASRLRTVGPVAMPVV